MISAGYVKDLLAVGFFAIGIIYVLIYKTIPYPAILFFFVVGFFVDATFSANPDYHNAPWNLHSPATQVTIGLPIMILIIFYAFRKSLFITTTPK